MTYLFFFKGRLIKSNGKYGVRGVDTIEAIHNVNKMINEWIETAILTKRTIPVAKGRLLFA